MEEVAVEHQVLVEQQHYRQEQVMVVLVQQIQ
jgi:hypothetical protein